jgi:hypothetical protein
MEQKRKSAQEELFCQGAMDRRQGHQEQSMNLAMTNPTPTSRDMADGPGKLPVLEGGSLFETK